MHAERHLLSESLQPRNRFVWRPVELPEQLPAELGLSKRPVHLHAVPELVHRPLWNDEGQLRQPDRLRHVRGRSRVHEQYVRRLYRGNDAAGVRGEAVRFGDQQLQPERQLRSVRGRPALHARFYVLQARDLRRPLQYVDLGQLRRDDFLSVEQLPLRAGLQRHELLHAQSQPLQWPVRHHALGRLRPFGDLRLPGGPGLQQHELLHAEGQPLRRPVRHHGPGRLRRLGQLHVRRGQHLLQFIRLRAKHVLFRSGRELRVRDGLLLRAMPWRAVPMTRRDSPTSLAAMPFAPGTVLVGKYKVERLLGQGGMGSVVVATHLQLEQRVAIKFMHATSTKRDEEAVGRFVREAKAAARIQSEHVARVSDVGTLENGSPYLVMEYLEGRDLEAELRWRTDRPIALVIDYAMQTCEGLAEAHAAGIVHRDLKPSNLFLAERADGSVRVKLLDFGISKLMTLQGDPSEPVMTSTQTLMGSPLYMSPEQLRSSRNVDHRSDIWSMGVILYEMLAGRPPFAAATMPEVCARIMAEPPASLCAANQAVPADLEAVAMRCLEKDPEQRFADVGELALALAPFGSPEARAASERIARLIQRTVGERLETNPYAGAASESATKFTQSGVVQTNAAFITADRPQTRSASKPWWFAGGAAVLLVAGSVGGLVASRGRSAPANIAPPHASVGPPSAMPVPPASPTALTPLPDAVPVVDWSSLPAAPAHAAASAATAKTKPRPRPAQAQATVARPAGTSAFGGRD